ncbi:MAG: STAS domain-containing protein [Bacteroidia bacterium]|nr:STAS domain-containing protein [Bacteroidia bacterium]
MNLHIEKLKNHTIVRVDGRIDTINSIEFQKPMMELTEEGCTNIIIDCSGLNYISSSGLRVLLTVQKKMVGKSGLLSITNLQPHIRDIFDISGFSTIFSVFRDNEAAMKNNT